MMGLPSIGTEDLLCRAPARLDSTGVRARISGQVVLVTGAGGSIGSELCRRIVNLQPAALIGFDQSEIGLYEIEQELKPAFPALPFFPEIGSIQSPARLEELFARYRPTAVYHAAAYKHVPIMEAHPLEAIENNVFGTRNVARSAVRWGVRDFVLISTDKAVRPASVMGATKRAAEMVSLREAFGSSTKSAAVRLGNVLDSSGSVIPRFRKQILDGGPVTVTHPEMRRFFMTIPEAAQLVLEAGALGSGGEIFVLEMGEPVRILDLARKMILLSGLRPDIDIPIVFSGLRPGEKIREELSAYGENTVPTPHSQIRIFTGPAPDAARLDGYLARLYDSIHARDAARAIAILQELVPEYSPSRSLIQKPGAKAA